MNDIRPIRGQQSPRPQAPGRPPGPPRGPMSPRRTNPQLRGAVPPPISRPLGRPPLAPLSTQTPPLPPIKDLPSPPSRSSSSIAAPRRKKGKIILWIIGAIVAFLALVAAVSIFWYNESLRAVREGDTTRVRLEIPSGAAPSEIGQLLEEKGLIRSHYAFEIYTRLSETRSQLQAGTYSLSPSEPMEAIVHHIVSGNVDQFSITFLPGATLAENRKGLINAGYSEAEVDGALKKTYTNPLFTDKPEDTDLEGYMYGDTYNFTSDATVEEVLQKTFDHYYRVVKENNFVEKFKAHGLTLYQGITLASIIQREVSSATDQKQVAQVFYRRLSEGMTLGSDVTYQYAAKKLGVPPSPTLDSPYNTRKYAGLPPGPIATPGLGALQAVADPAAGDFLFFLSGDDNVTYFARTDAEHQANIQNHCHAKCALP